MNYQKYMSMGGDKKDASGATINLASKDESSGGQSGDYQKYMDYQKHIPQGRSKHVGGQVGDYQQSMDYPMYMPQGGGKDSIGPGGDYQHYTEYQKHMSQGGKHGGGPGGDYLKYYKKYMSQGRGKNESDTTNDLDASDSNRLPHDNSGASVPASAPVIALAASGDIPDAKSVPASTSSVSAIAPLDARAAVLETDLVSETSSRTGWRTWLFLATALPAAGIVLCQRRSHGSCALMTMPESSITMPLLRNVLYQVEADMTRY